MIPVDHALEIILHHLPPVQFERVPLAQAIGSVIAEDVYSDIDLPPFNKSAMDGYAVRVDDLKNLPIELELIETVPAGKSPQKILKSGKATKIMTGAPVPQGADTVVIQENTKEQLQNHTVRFLQLVKRGENICRRGEDLRKNEKVISVGSLLRPQEISILASVGKSKPQIYRSPKVAILTTGNELVQVDIKPQKAQIRNSNSYGLTAQLAQMNIKPELLGIATDNLVELTKKVSQGLTSDILIITGGVSVGKYDIVKDVLRQLKVRILFHRVAIKPGKPFLFGQKKGCRVFGLPGNPVSSFVITEVFIRPFIARLLNNDALIRPIVKARITAPFLEISNRQQYVLAQVEFQKGKWKVTPVFSHGSADLVSLRQANSLIIVPAHSRPLKRNDKVTVMLLNAK